MFCCLHVRLFRGFRNTGYSGKILTRYSIFGGGGKLLGHETFR